MTTVVDTRNGRRVEGKIAEVRKEKVILWAEVRRDAEGHAHGYGRKLGVFNRKECRVVAHGTRPKGR